MGNVRRNTKSGEDTSVLEGIRDDALAALPRLPLAGTFYTPATLAAFIQSHLDAANAVDSAKGAWLAAVRAYRVVDAKRKVVLRDLRAQVIAAHGPDSPTLAALGLSPPKQAVLTAEQKVLAAQKRLATRKARKTMGRKQRLAIKGVVPVTTPGETVAIEAPLLATPLPPQDG